MRISDWSSDVCSSDLLKDHLGTLFRDHDDGSIRVARNERGHDRRVDDAQPADAPNAQARIDHRRLVGAHPARSRKMMARAGTLPDVSHPQSVVPIDRRTAAELVRASGRERVGPYG